MAERSLSDRTMISVGKSSISMPRILKRLLETAIASGLTALVSLFIIIVNSMLTAKGGFAQGFEIWSAFVRRPDIVATIALTAIVALSYYHWQSRQDRR
jgi:ABC-type sulfate transport system permease subunit